MKAAFEPPYRGKNLRWFMAKEHLKINKVHLAKKLSDR